MYNNELKCFWLISLSPDAIYCFSRAQEADLCHTGNERDGEEESPISADWLWNALLRLVWFKFGLQMVALFDKVGIFTDWPH